MTAWNADQTKLDLAYERVIRMVEEKDVTPETDQLLQRLGEEWSSGRNSGEALSAAIHFLAQCCASLPNCIQRIASLMQHLSNLEPRKRLRVLVRVISNDCQTLQPS